ncbi:DUF3137 domain-containing protein [Erythrobacter sp.]|nr:DUF3137 domain-containing protein [Erythrobacter sp.]
MRTDVQGLMKGELGDWLHQQSDMRAEAKEKAFNRWTWGAAGLLPLIAFLWFGPFFSGPLKIFLCGGGIMAVAAWGHKPIADAKKSIKIGINSAIAQSLGVQYAHDVEPGGEYEACRTYGLVPDYDRSSFEDRWFGNIEGHGFELYEAHLEERRGSNKNRRWVTVFRGAIIAMEFGRQFHSTTLLQRAGKHKKWFGLGGRADNVKFAGHQLDCVDQVHPAFDDVFDLWSDDQVEARVLVHPSYVEHLIAVEKAFQGEAVRALFTRGSVVIAVESSDLFESGSLDTSGDEARVAEAAEQFEALAGLALAINQNERGRVLNKVDPQPIGGFGRRRRGGRG